MSFDTLGLAPELLRARRRRGLHRAHPGAARGHPAGPRSAATCSPAPRPAPARPRPSSCRSSRSCTRRAWPARAQPPSQQGRRSAPATRAARPSASSSSSRPASSPSRSRRASGPTASTARSARPPSTAASASSRRPRELRAGPEIVVATPGRLLDHVGQRTIDLSRVEILVLDEADRMLDMGFIRDIRKIIGLLPPRRQNLLFSATFSDDVRGLAAGLLHEPAPRPGRRRGTRPTELVEQVVIPVDRERKRELLSHLIRSGRIDQALVFTRTKHGANRLAEQLRQGRHQRGRDPRQQEPGPARSRPRRLQGRPRRHPRRDRPRGPRPRHRRSCRTS